LQQLFAEALEHGLAQLDLASPSFAQEDDFAADDEQHDFAGAEASLLELTFSVFAFSAEVTFCADTLLTVKAKIRENNEITRATFFIGMDY
jgi:hypothetical protein